jgi:hypothetical protein
VGLNLPASHAGFSMVIKGLRASARTAEERGRKS